MTRRRDRAARRPGPSGDCITRRATSAPCSRVLTWYAFSSRVRLHRVENPRQRRVIAMTTTGRQSLLASLPAGLMSRSGCARQGASSASADQVARQLRVVGFDAEGEPVVHVLADGTICIVFEAMPPFFAEDRGIDAEFADFDAVISKAIGVPVIRDDREVFLIRNPPEGTAERIQEWLADYHKRKP